MTTTTLTAASPPTLDLEARFALIDATMTLRLEQAALAFAVNTAHLPGADPIPDITAPLPLTPTAAPNPYNTPIAGALHRARQRIEQDGWCRDAVFDEQGAICPIRAIRLEAATRHQADDACVLLLDAIQRDFADAETIPSWNAAQTSPAPVLLYLDKAAQLAHTRSI
ncbi:DUF6197 family protein [Streptomyces sp.]|uniref:DUF6197 family protein n=1 Tax=Streptomyces sp. TaxID=1931 RepID=UPI002F91EEB7